MVYMHFPLHLTEEEEMLQKKYAKLKKRKKALAALRAPKQEHKEPANVSRKRPAEAAADATEQAKKLLKAGTIKVEAEKRDYQTFKRTKRLKDPEKAPVGFQPFSPAHSSDPDEDKTESGRPKVRSLYESFVSTRDKEPRREEKRELDPPKKGNTVYIHGHGITEDIISKAFSNFGTIININMELEKSNGFITFEKMESADEAIAQMNGSMVSGVQLKVSMARRQPAFENALDPSSVSWSTIAASSSQKGSHKDKRDLVTYDTDSIF